MEHRAYDPWGVRLEGRLPAPAVGATGGVREGFTGKPRLVTAGGIAAGLDDFGARMYAPAVGRFLQTDPLWTKHAGWTPYHYVLNNPLRFIDPDGRQVDSGQGLWRLAQARSGGDSERAAQIYSELYREQNAANAKGLALVGSLFFEAVDLGMAAWDAFRNGPGPEHALSIGPLPFSVVKRADNVLRSADDLAGAAGTAGRSFPNGVFEAAPYHGAQRTGRKSPGPTNGQQSLDNSVQISSNSPRRVAYDPTSGEFVVLDRTRETPQGQSVYHGHAVEWSDLRQNQKNALIRSGVVNERGRPIR